jgi:predicted nucleic acid-binding protein
MSDENHPMADLAFRRVQSDSAVVPSIWWYEVRNILLVNERRNRISRSDSTQFLSDLDSFSIQVLVPADGPLTLDLARKHDLSVYDAAYLALAMQQNIPLATLDKALQTAAASINIPPLA